MSDYQSPQNSSNPQHAQNIGPQGNTDEHSPSPTIKAPPNSTRKPEIDLPCPGKMRSLESSPKTSNKTEKAWKPLDIPGTVKVGTAKVNTAKVGTAKVSTPSAAGNASSAEISPTKVPLKVPPAEISQTSKIPASAPNLPPDSTLATNREAELLTLIHDLNDCNDVLLSRVTQLESDLEKAQAALKTEIEKATFAQSKMAKQVSAEQASAQQISQTAQQQVAKLVSELEAKEQALGRQQLINENLQIELTNGQERVTQLEHESALISQQHAEEVQARIKAETASRDLRSRLQRQQRYTMQFKAALEKSLTTTNTRNPAPTAESTQSIAQPAPPDPFTGTAVTMPKAQRIMPWAADTSPLQGIDPHLETLIRNVSKPAHEVVPHTPIDHAPIDHAPINNAPIAAELATAPSSPDIPNNVPAPPLSNPGAAVDPAAEAKLWQDLEHVINTTATPTPEPKLNWQEAAAKRDTAALTTPPSNNREKTAVDIVNETESSFTEPSPWVKPLPTSPTTTPATATTPPPTSNYLPDTTSESVIAPVVKPLHTPTKKVSSMAAVELPTFERAKAGSFKR